jgi:hypothetical protein
MQSIKPLDAQHHHTKKDRLPGGLFQNLKPTKIKSASLRSAVAVIFAIGAAIAAAIAKAVIAVAAARRGNRGGCERR